MTKKIVCFVVLVVYCDERKKVPKKREVEGDAELIENGWTMYTKKYLTLCFLTYDLFANVAIYNFGWCKNPFCFIEIVTQC